MTATEKQENGGETRRKRGCDVSKQKRKQCET